MWGNSWCIFSSPTLNHMVKLNRIFTLVLRTGWLPENPGPRHSVSVMTLGVGGGKYRCASNLKSIEAFTLADGES